ncbi:MAG: SAM-dependent methyltransferase [Clostridium sp.]|nr:SAM-dependent methyltransferase [Clostridium sp.]
MNDKEKFLKKFEKLAEKYGTADAWRRFIVAYACSISNLVTTEHFEEREKLYKEQITTDEELMMFSDLAAIFYLAMLENPYQDFLGDVYQRLSLGSNARGQIFTPYHISHFMAETTFAGKDCSTELKSKGYVSVYDPCCGSGVMLLAGAEVLQKRNFNCSTEVLLVGRDIDRVVALMCYVQLSIPGYAGYVSIGDSLSDDDADGDVWYTPALCTSLWQERLSR